jgi:hypothetical protein
MSQKVRTVDYVKLHVSHGKAKTLIITAIGTVPTAAWTNAHLVAFVYVMAPVDGIYDFDFVAQPPTGIPLDVVSVIPATLAWPDYPDDVKGVRIHSSTNFLEKPLSGAEPLSFP